MTRNLVTRTGLVAGVAALAAVPLLPVGTFWTYLLLGAFVQAILIVSLNLAVGYAGLLSLAHTGFYALGGYATAYLTARHGLDPGIGVAFGIVVGLAGGLLVSLGAWRARAVYFSLITLAFLQLAHELVSRWPPLGGFRGISGVPPIAAIRSTDPPAYWLVLAGLVLAVILSRHIVRSPVGRALMTVRDGERMASSLGVDSARARVFVLAVSGAMAGFAGALFAHTAGGIFPEAATLPSAIKPFLALFLGGVGTVAGPLVGAAAVLGMERATTSIEFVQPLAFSLVLLITLGAMPRGVVGSVQERLRRRAIERGDGRRPTASVPAILAPTPSRHDGPTLLVTGLTKRYGDVMALQGVDLEIAAGSVHGLIGRNGSGKSTLVDIISGVQPPDAGTVVLDGRILRDHPPHARTRLGLVRTFQHVQSTGALPVVDQVLLGTEIDGARRLVRGLGPLRSRRAGRDRLARATAILEMLRLPTHVRVLGSDLTPARRRLVEIAAAVATQPRLLALDEPAAGLDEPERQALTSVIRTLRDAGTAILLIEHDHEFVAGLADAVTVMDDGRTRPAPADGFARERPTSRHDATVGAP